MARKSRCILPWGIALGLFLLLLGVATACSSGGNAEQESPTPSLTRVNEAGNVTIEATWVTAAHRQQLALPALSEYPPEDYILIHLTLDTHSVDLSKYQLATLAVLTLPDGSSAAPAAWVGISDSGHHREDILVFPGQVDEEGLPPQGGVQMVLRGIAGVSERIFRWE